MSDLSAQISQSACDKLMDSITYPFIAAEKNEPFPGCSNMAAADTDTAFYRYKDTEADALLANCVKTVRTRGTSDTDVSIEDQIYAFGGSIIQQAKLIRDACEHPDYEGPDKAQLDKIIDGGIEHLGAGLRGIMGDWGIYAWCPRFRITVKSRPSLKLASPRIDLDGIRVEIRATGELYAKYPWWNCYKWCLKWEKVHKCDRIASATVAPDIAIDAHADLTVAGLTINAQGTFDKLRLDYPILRDLPLEGLANKLLAARTMTIYDASKLIATVPVVESRFVIEALDLPASPHGIEVGVTLRAV